ANNGAAIINPKVLAHEKDGDYAQAYLSEHTMGSGAFQVDSWEKGQQIVMTPNPHYAEAPAFKSVEIRIIKEASARQLQLEHGDHAVAEKLTIEEFSTRIRAEGVVGGEWPSFRVTYLYLDNGRGPVADAEVRVAVSYAIEYD